MNSEPVKLDMSREASVEDEVLLPEELSDALAAATDTPPEEIERGAVELDFAPPEEADVVRYGKHNGEHGFLADPGGE